MSETPKCPYCGAETRLNENNKGICWYECRECNATGPTEKTPVEAFSAALHRADPDTTCQQLSKVLCSKENATLEEMLEAVEQVKHRAEPKNRPMMLKEVKAHCTKGPDAEPLWVEFREKCTIPIWSFATIAPGVFDRPVLSEWIATGRSKEYGKVWRCWPRKPTPEQMQTAKWEEE